MTCHLQWNTSKIIAEECSKIKNCQPRLLYLAKLSFKGEGGIKTFLGK